MSKESRRLGSGWKHLGSSVWQHPSGIRIHCLGRALWPDGTTRHWKMEEEHFFRRLMGGKTKRSLMAWALSLMPNLLKPQPNKELSHAAKEVGNG